MKPIYRCRVCGRYVEEPYHCGRPADLVIDGRRRLALSKLMSALLRHIPWEAGLSLDRGGWVRVDELVRAIRERWRNRHLYQWVKPEHIIAVALTDPKGRFELSSDLRLIRARYGHSIRVNVGYRPDPNPPPKLYHATPERNLEAIMAVGLQPMKRLYVHLAVRPEDAIEAGRRHGGPLVLLEVDTRCLKDRGVPVYRASHVIYLAPHIPPQCIRVLSRPVA